MTDALRDEATIAHEMINVHGTEAATVARANAHAAALAGQAATSKILDPDIGDNPAASDQQGDTIPGAGLPASSLTAPSPTKG
jgi:putative alpha-1,2-mannosidase